MKITLALIVPSFVFFYGWGSLSNTNRQQQADEDAYGSFLPPGGDKPVEMNRDDLLFAQWQLRSQVNRQVAMLQYREQQYNPDKKVDEQSVALEVKDLGDMGKILRTEDLQNECLNKYALDLLAQERGFTVNEEELKSIIARRYSGYPKSMWESLIRYEGMHQGNYRQYLATTERLNRARRHLAGQGKASKFELWELFRIEKEEIALDYVSFDVNKFTAKVKEDAAAVTAYYEENKEDFRVADQRQYEYAYLGKNDLRKTIAAPTTKTLQAYYDAQKDQYKKPLRVQISHIFFSLSASNLMQPDQKSAFTTETLNRATAIKARALTEDFAQLADDISRDAANTKAGKKQGGKIDGWITTLQGQRYGMDFVTAALALKKGEVSDPVKINLGPEKGFSIIKCDEVREEGPDPFSEIRVSVERDLLTVLTDEAFYKWGRDAQTNDTLRSYTNLGMMAKAHGMKSGLTSWTLTTDTRLKFGRDSVTVGEVDMTHVNDLNDRTTGANRSELLESSNPYNKIVDAFYVLEYKGERASHIPPLAEIKTDVERANREAKKRELAKAAAEKFIEDTNTTASLSVLAAAGDGVFTTTSLFTRQEPPRLTGYSWEDFDINSMASSEGELHICAAGYQPDTPTHYIVWRLREIKEVDPVEFKKDITSLHSRIVGAKSVGILDDWLSDQRQAMRIIPEDETKDAKKTD